MDMLIGAAVSVLTGVALWAFLPRGVVLIRSFRECEGVQEVWEVRNDSPLPVQITSVKVMGAITYNEESQQIDQVELAPEYLPGDKYFGFFSLAFMDDTTENLRTSELPPWRGQVVVPGDALRATVVHNSRMVIKYRRAGWSGVVERRELRIDGGT